MVFAAGKSDVQPGVPRPIHISRNRLRPYQKGVAHLVLSLSFMLAVAMTSVPALALTEPALPMPGGDPALLCERATRIASRETGVPEDLLLAIALTETGRGAAGSRRPWPWALNLGGPGFWLDTRAEAEAQLRKAQQDGRTNIDIGCFQLNLRWHGAAFASPASMFDPLQNARYAAEFLRQLHAEFGDWERAIGAYHSRTPELAARYRRLFAINLASLRTPPVRGRAGAAGIDRTAPVPVLKPLPDLPEGPRLAGRSAPGLFPLFQAGAPISPGSLMPDLERAAPGLLRAPLRALGERG